MCIVLLTAATPSESGENVAWDPDCEPLNRAYATTRGTDRYSVVLYRVASDGALTPQLQWRFTERDLFERDVSSNTGKWLRSNPPAWAIWDKMGPKFSSCTLVAKDSGHAGLGSKYTAKWHGYPYAADAEIWLSSDDQRFAKVLRHYQYGRWQFAFPVAMEVFNFDPASASRPAAFKSNVVD